MRISLLHATRGRPERALEVRREWLEKATRPDEIEHIFGIDADDAQTIDAVGLLRRVIVLPPKGCFRAYNHAAAVSDGDLLIPIEDNLHCEPGWDDQVRQVMAEHIDTVATLSVGDGTNEHIEWCFTRAFYLERGLYHDDYFGLFGDTELRLRARQDGVGTVLSRIVFPHEAMHDQIMARKQAKYLVDEATFNRRAREGWPR